MSYILDALKKIEHEKNKKSHPDGRISISGDLFHERKRPAARARIWKVAALIAAASLLTCAGTWFVLRGNGKKSVAVIRPAAPPRPVSVNLPVGPAPVPVPVQAQTAPAAVAPAAPIVAAPIARKDRESLTADDSVRPLKKRSKAQPLATPPKPAVQTVPAPADIKLSGIAWQDEHAARRAVINGYLLKEGAVVSGAKITDIQSDRVRFSSAAGVFEIKLDSVLPAEVHK